MQISTDWLYVVVPLLGFIFIAFVGKRAGWFKIIGGTNQLLREQNTELRNQNAYLKGQIENTITVHEQDKKDWAARHAESLTEIAKLQGKVETLTAIPLRAIDKTLQQMVELTKQNADSNSKILEELQKTSAINAEDRDVLTNQNKHIRDEVHKITETDIKGK